MIKKWAQTRAEKASQNRRAKLVEEMRLVAGGVNEHGFITNVEETVTSQGFRAQKIYTVGLWTAGQPELVGFGPIGGLTSETLNQIGAAYLSLGHTPEDGDLVVMDGVRWDVREILELNDRVTAALLAFMFRITTDELWHYAPDRVFQIVPECGSPENFYTSEANSGRTIEASGDFSNEKIAQMVHAIRKSARLT